MSFRHLHWIHVCGSVPNDYILTSHLIASFSLRWYFNFFLTFNSSIVTLDNTNITCDCTFVIFGGSLFFLTFDGSIVTLGSTNITFDCTFATFGCTRIFFSHLIVPFSNSAVPTSHVIVLLSHSVLRLFFFF